MHPANISSSASVIDAYHTIALDSQQGSHCFRIEQAVDCHLQTSPNPFHAFLLVAELRKLLLRLVVHLGLLLGLGKTPPHLLLALVVGLALDLSPLFQSRNNILVFPSNLVAQTSNGAVLAAGLQSEDTESLWDNHLLLLVVRRRNALEDLETLHGGSTAGSLVRNHAANGLVENAGRSTEMEGATTGRIVTGHLAEVGVVFELRAEELARDVEGFAADNNDLLAIEKLLGDSAGETAKQVTFAVNDDDRLEGRHPEIWVLDNRKSRKPAKGSRRGNCSLESVALYLEG